MEKENATFREVVNETRKIMSVEFLAAGVPLIEVADKLGFSDQAAFGRAFKRWTGRSPSQYS